MKNFGEFFNDQIENAGTIVLSHTGHMSDEKIAAAVALLREHNAAATVITTDWALLDGAQILRAMEREDSLEAELARLAEEHRHGHHHHDHEEDDDECCHHHHHDHEEDDDECCHHHHHDHEDDDECCHHHHHHDHDHEHHHHHHHGEGECHDPDCDCHHHHHADEVFVSCGAETTKRFTVEEIKNALEAFSEDSVRYGMVLRAKGIVENAEGGWIHFDYVPGEPDVRAGSAGVIGRFCVIGSGLKLDAISEAFGVELKA